MEEIMKQDANIGSTDKQGEPKKDLAYYYNMKNPVTGLRYDIPMLNTLDPDYYYKYVNFMKIKEQQPDLFDKILRWD
jgi:hypothetical protein